MGVYTPATLVDVGAERAEDDVKPMVKALGTRPAPVDPEVHVFLIWSNALDRADAILADIRSRFTIVDVFCVEWSRKHFATNLTRFYGQTLPSGSDKEMHCGVDPFLVVVVQDPQPAYAPRRTTRGRVTLNVRMFAAKKRYRRWTGGGHRVHATVNTREADKDLFLLLGLRTASYTAPGEWDGTIVPLRRDLTGADGWANLEELLTAVETVTGYVALEPLPPSPRDDAQGSLKLLVSNAWWAAWIANGTGESDGDQRVQVGGRERHLLLTEVGDGSLDPVWQRELLWHPVRDSSGFLVPAEEDRFYLALHRQASNDSAVRAPGNYRDRRSAAAAVEAYLVDLRAKSGGEPAAGRTMRSLRPLTQLMRRAASRTG
jgi:hypothetical protein